MARRPVSRQGLGLLGWLLICFVAAALGGLASAHAGAFYRELARPSWAPPGWLFGPVWSLLYLLMALAAWVAFASALTWAVWKGNPQILT